jgi:type VI secretion system FHA domain protein
MPITLSVHRYRGDAPPQPLSHRYDRLGGTLGRAPGNDLVLDDPGKYISRQHARIEYRDGGWCLLDVGSNPSIVNERPVGAGRHVRLNDGDRIAIGDYALVASVQDEEGTAALPPLELAPAPAPAFAPAPASAIQPRFLPEGYNPDDSLAGASILDVGGDPLNPAFDPLGLNLFGTPAQVPPAPDVPAYRGAESDHVAPEHAAFTFAPAPVMPPLIAPAPVALPPQIAPVPPAPAAAPSLAIPDDYDPLADFLPPRVQASPPPAVQPVAPPAPPAAPPPVASPAAAAFEPPPPAPIFAPPVPPAPPSPAPEAAPAMPAPRAGTVTAADDPVIQALLRGLGLTELRTRRSAEEVAEMAGAMLREATAGTMEVLTARALTKRESRLEMTMISAQANNPLKFFPDAATALAQMMDGTMPGYMAPPRAFANAFDDLKAHELAMMAGMRAALAGVLKRFDPAAIEARLDEPGVMDKLLAANRKARMWDRMVELYRQLALEADDDFQRLFGAAFASAYEEQTARLRKPQR